MSTRARRYQEIDASSRVATNIHPEPYLCIVIAYHLLIATPITSSSLSPIDLIEGDALLYLEL